MTVLPAGSSFCTKTAWAPYGACGTCADAAVADARVEATARPVAATTVARRAAGRREFMTLLQMGVCLTSSAPARPAVLPPTGERTSVGVDRARGHDVVAVSRPGPDRDVRLRAQRR